MKPYQELNLCRDDLLFNLLWCWTSSLASVKMHSVFLLQGKRKMSVVPTLYSNITRYIQRVYKQYTSL